MFSPLRSFTWARPWRCTAKQRTRSSTSARARAANGELDIQAPGLSLGDIERDYGTTFQEALKDSAAGPFYPPLDWTRPAELSVTLDYRQLRVGSKSYEPGQQGSLSQAIQSA